MNPQEILPSPEVEKTPDSQEHAESFNEEASVKKTERKSVASTGFGAVSAVAVDDAQTKVQGAVGVAGAATIAATTQLDTPEVAEDVDLIEKEWVKKAKEIVASTQGDPHKQNNQINKIKVDYIKKRYNKDIKFKEE